MKPNLLKLKKAQLIELLNRLERRNPGCVASAMKETDASIYYHDMKALIDNILHPYLDHGFLHRRDVRKVVGVMEKLIDKIEDQQFEVGVERTFWECMAIIEMWNDQLCQTDDSSGYVTPMVDMVWSVLNDALEFIPTEDDRKRIAKYLLKVFSTDRLKEWDWHVNPVDCILNIHAGKEIDSNLLKAVEAQKDEWVKESLSIARIKLTRRLKGEEAAKELVQSLLIYDNVRLSEIARAIDIGDYKYAQSLCDDALNKRKAFPQSGNRWMYRLYDIAESHGDKEAMARALIHLVSYTDGHVMDNWNKLCRIVSKEKADEVLENVASRFLSGDGEMHKGSVIQLLGFQRKCDTLIAFLRMDGRAHYLEQAGPFLVDHAEEMTGMWTKAMLDELRFMNSSQYHAVARHLSTIKGQLGLIAAKSVRDQIMAEHPLKIKLASQLDAALGHA